MIFPKYHFLLYLILSTNNINSAKFSSFISILSLNVTAFNLLNILTVSPVNISAFIIFLYHFQNSKKSLLPDISSHIGKHFLHDILYLLFYYLFSFHNLNYISLLFLFEFIP